MGRLRLFTCLAALTYFAGLAGCDSSNPVNRVTSTPAAFDATPRVRFFDAAPLANRVTVSIAIGPPSSKADPSATPTTFPSSPPMAGFDYDEAMPYQSIKEGRGSASVTTLTGATLALKPVEILRSTDYLLVLAGEISATDPTQSTLEPILVTSDKLDDPPFQSSAIRFVQAAVGLPDIDIYLLSPGADIKKTPPQFTGVKFKGYTLYYSAGTDSPTLPAGLYRVVITETGKKDAITYQAVQLPLNATTPQTINVTPGVLPLESQQRYTAVLSGKLGSADKPLQLMLLRDEKAPPPPAKPAPTTGAANSSTPTTSK